MSLRFFWDNQKKMLYWFQWDIKFSAEIQFLGNVEIYSIFWILRKLFIHSLCIHSLMRSVLTLCCVQSPVEKVDCKALNLPGRSTQYRWRGSMCTRHLNTRRSALSGNKFVEAQAEEPFWLEGSWRVSGRSEELSQNLDMLTGWVQIRTVYFITKFCPYFLSWLYGNEIKVLFHFHFSVFFFNWHKR
jgi:hypothetical protein